MTTFTFRMSANGPVALTVEADTVADAYMEANRTLAPSIPGFYAWFTFFADRSGGTPGDGPDFYATTGAWD